MAGHQKGAQGSDIKDPENDMRSIRRAPACRLFPRSKDSTMTIRVPHHAQDTR